MAPDGRTSSSRPVLAALGKFTAIGVLATGIHGLAALVAARWLGPLAANAVGFAVAVLVTYAGNYRFTFGASGAHGETIVRFAVVSAATLAASEWTLVFLALLGADERAALLLAAGVIPLFRFGLMANQVFDNTRWGDGGLRSWVRDWVVVVTAAAAGVGALWVTHPTILDHHGDPAHPAAMSDAADRYLTGDWGWQLLSIPPSGSGATMTPVGARPPVPLLAVPAKVARPLVGADSGYLEAWMLLSFTAIGPAVLFVAHSLGARSWIVRVIAAAGSIAVFSMAVEPHRLTLQSLFLVVLAAGILIRISRQDRCYRGAPVAAACVVTTVLADRLAGAAALAVVVSVMVTADLVRPSTWRLESLSGPARAMAPGGLARSAILNMEDSRKRARCETRTQCEQRGVHLT